MLMLVFTLLSRSGAKRCERDPESDCANRPGGPKKDSRKDQAVLQESLNSGKFIRLSDDTLWEINPKDTAITKARLLPSNHNSSERQSRLSRHFDQYADRLESPMPAARKPFHPLQLRLKSNSHDSPLIRPVELFLQLFESL